MACADDGSLYVVFSSNRGGTQDIYCRVCRNGVWSPDTPIVSGPGDEYEAVIALDGKSIPWICWSGNGNAMPQETRYNIFAARIQDISAPLDYSQVHKVTESDDDAMHCRMVFDRNGKLWITYYKWHSTRGVSRDKEIYLRCYDGNKWSEEVQVSPGDVPNYEDHTDPCITSLGDTVAIAWSWDFHRPEGYTRDAREPTIFINLVGTDMKPSRPRDVSGNHIDISPTMSADSESRLWCAWDSLKPSSTRKAYRKSLYIRLMEPGGKETPVMRPLSDQVVNICTPCFARAPSGALALVWAENKNGDRWLLFRSVLSPGSSLRWSMPEPVVTEGNPRFPSAVYDIHGTLWISYSVDCAKGREIRVVSVPPAGSTTTVPYPDNLIQ